MNNVTFGDGTSGYYETVAGGAGAVSLVLSLPIFLLKRYCLKFCSLELYHCVNLKIYSYYLNSTW